MQAALLNVECEIVLQSDDGRVRGQLVDDGNVLLIAAR